MRKTPTLCIVQGFLGAGKTTFSRKLAEEMKAVRLNGDEWCAENFPPVRLGADWDACFAEAIAKLWIETERLLDSGADVILDFGFWDRRSRDHAREKANALNARLVHYYLCAPDDILLARLKKRSGGVASKNVRDFTALKKSFEEPAADEDAVVIMNGEA